MAGICGILGCAGIQGNKYEELKPTLTLEEYFSGEIEAWGVVQDRSGNILTRFDIDLFGSWSENEGTLEEHFQFYDGRTQKRTWKITRTGENSYRGTAGDIIGEAVGKHYGNAVKWKYRMDLPVDDTTYRITFEDWMWLMNDGVLLNRSYMKKFGIVVGEITIFMRKKNA